jgi:hypothetical protein
MRIAGIVLALMTTATFAAPLPPDRVPDPLKTWIPWATQGHEDANCPARFDSGDDHRCSYIGRLDLTLRREGGRFSQNVQQYRAGWLALPGNGRSWPQNVKLDGQLAVVLTRSGLPGVEVPAGTHALSGDFAWRELPESLALPPQTALVARYRPLAGHRASTGCRLPCICRRAGGCSTPAESTGHRGRGWKAGRYSISLLC